MRNTSTSGSVQRVTPCDAHAVSTVPESPKRMPPNQGPGIDSGASPSQRTCVRPSEASTSGMSEASCATTTAASPHPAAASCASGRSQ
ncbi:hypothetical protein QEG98_18905 [Myxococcus sp. MxC21-1]|nr:hypothetical protein QEG98_18905 [Myxococcus sp. MxC21-1]